MAKTGGAQIFLLEPTRITLQVAGRIVEPLDFLIRKPPRSGTLSDLRRTGRNSASVLYTPNRNATPSDDAFTFAAKSADSPVSAPATIWVRLTERPPVLDFPTTLDFGTIFLGDSTELDLPLANSGGGTAYGQLNPPPPWRMVGKPDYALRANAKTSLRIAFEPKDERSYLAKLSVGPEPKSVVELSGRAIAPLSWPPTGLVISPEARAQGAAELTVTNQTDQPRELNFTWPEFLRGPSSLTIPARESATLSVSADAAPAFASQGFVPIESGKFQSSIPFRLFPAPPRLALEPADELSLPPPTDNLPSSAKLILKNIGGSDTAVSVTAPPQLSISPDPSSRILAAGSELVFEAKVENPSAKPFTGTIQFSSPSTPPVSVSVTGGQSAEASAVALSMASPSPKPSPQPEQIVSRITPTLVSASPHAVTIAWDGKGTTGFRVERRQLAAGPNGRVEITWLPWNEVKIATSPNQVIARFENLPSNTFWTIRIIPLDPNGKPSPPSEAFRISTPPIPNLDIPAWIWLLAALGLGSLIYRAVHRHRERLLQKEDARIAKLENP